MFNGNNFLKVTQKGLLTGAIALGGFGIISTALACEFILPDQKAMAQTSTQVSGSHPLAIALRAAQQEGYVNEGTWQEYIEIIHDSAEAPSKATVVITQTGFLDDSVQGHQFLVTLTKNELGNWQLIDIDKEWICYRGISESGLCL
ncbi:hypothetical protein [[Limnothrix rosea] IAM M-220]|uniref:hypothetical protein n=1 Tax=[Limnothrix rosea] IAM M-220 TaxID=454133 RepID=UPI000967B639|nr:hypothetical protein [[Limnothrix rosea] IAM M-220]OKH10804.1 hypothetical protein NIES208_18175 [[Limnothrix rosea] IAM M-220]